jgi:hypothetical protein
MESVISVSVKGSEQVGQKNLVDGLNGGMILLKRFLEDYSNRLAEAS